jgi:hypothetical protein
VIREDTFIRPLLAVGLAKGVDQVSSFDPRGRRHITRAAIGLAFVLAWMWAGHIVVVAYIPGLESYHVAQQFIRSSPEISAKVGRITDLTDISASAFLSSSSSDWKDAYFRIRETGTSGAIVVLDRARRRQGYGSRLPPL